VPRFLFYFSLILVLISGLPAHGQRAFLSDYANEQLQNVPPDQQDSFFLVQGRYYYAFYTRESYRRAMECYLEALRLAINLKHQDIIIKCYFGIGSVYDANNNLPQAIRYYKMNYDGVLKERPFKPINILRATYNIAATYAKAKDTQNAYHYSLKMGQMLNWISDEKDRENYRLLIAHTFAGIGKNDEFMEYFSKIPASVEFKDGELAYGRLYAETKSRYALQTGKRGEVIAPLIKELARTKDSIPLLNLLLKSYAALGDYKKAYECQQMLITADMRSMDRSTYGDINYRLLEADNLLKQRQNNELKVNEEELRFHSSILYTVSLLLALVLAITVYLYRKFRTRNRFANQQSNLIQEHNEVNTLLMKELHHRVKNNLQTISSMMEMQLNKPETDLYFSMREVQAKMQTLAIAHQMMYEQSELKDVDLQTYFEDMVDMTLETLSVSAKPIEQRINMYGNKLPLEKLVILALAVNEMVINSVKHVLPYADDCYIAMECKLIDGEMHFTYSDNGPGITVGQETDETVSTITGTGIRLIHKLARQIDAKILVEKENNSKVQYLLIFNKN
jgi:two-component sensor histidine kinase